ncbi:MAG TPA: oligosaccharide flippase family protein [Pyrinomonadaceae bacterium]|nr:oligosaccharide flippase family protein [Pyrinomonadaceae bacterium]
MGQLERNTFASLISTVWSISLGVVCIPLYINLIGIEAFGLTGIFLTLQSIFVIFDLGIAATLNREIARLSAEDKNGQEQRDLVFTLQLIYWLIALLIGATVFALAPVIARRWVTLQSLSIETVKTCLRMMGVGMALQFPFTFYQSGLLGLQRQLLLNSLMVTLATMRGLGILLALWLISPTAEMFFAGQIATSVVGTGTAAILLWRSLPAPAESVSGFKFELIHRVWRFSASYAANSFANLGLLQGDKIILSALLPLNLFGYYTLAQSLTNGLYAIIIAINGAIFPKFSELVTRGGDEELSYIYHRGCQLMSVILMPVAIIMAIFSREVLMLWTGDPVIVEQTRHLLSLLVAGMLLHGLYQIPYYLQVAYGWWRLISTTNLLLLVSIIPLNVVLIKSYKGYGAGAVWVLLNLCYLITVPIMHRRFLRGQQGRWFLEDVCLPLSGALIVCGIAYWLIPKQLSPLETLACLSAAGLLAVVATAALASQIRPTIVAHLRRSANVL